MFSNLPVMLQHQDNMARCSDMLAAARSGVAYPKGTKFGRQIRVHLDKEILEEAKRRWQECAQQSSDFQKMIASAPQAKVGATLRIRLPADDPPPIVRNDSRKPWYLGRITEMTGAAEKIIADHQRVMAENIRLREQQEMLRPGMNRADFLAAVAQSCTSPTPPPSSPD